MLRILIGRPSAVWSQLVSPGVLGMPSADRAGCTPARFGCSPRAGAAPGGEPPPHLNKPRDNLCEDTLRLDRPLSARIERFAGVVRAPLQRLKIERRRNTDGTWRWYGIYRTPDTHGNGTIRVRLDTTDEDRTRGFNRCEHLRPIPTLRPPIRRALPPPLRRRIHQPRPRRLQLARTRPLRWP
jgi:hypothetical protein